MFGYMSALRRTDAKESVGNVALHKGACWIHLEIDFFIFFVHLTFVTKLLNVKFSRFFSLAFREEWVSRFCMSWLSSFLRLNQQSQESC